MSLEDEIRNAFFPTKKKEVKEIPVKLVTVVTLLMRDTVNYPASYLVHKAETLSRDLAIMEAEAVARAQGKKFTMLIDVEVKEIIRYAKDTN